MLLSGQRSHTSQSDEVEHVPEGFEERDWSADVESIWTGVHFDAVWI